MNMEKVVTRPEPFRSADAWDQADLLGDFSLEVAARDTPALVSVARRVVAGSIIAVPYLHRETDDTRLAALRAVRHGGFEPMPHLSARCIPSLARLESFVECAVAQAGITQCLVVAGDPSTPAGPFPDSLSLIETGVFERAGINAISVGGHPGGHPIMSITEQWEVLERKCRRIEQRGMAPSIVTQFAFDADIVLTWLQALRQRGIRHPVRVGVPGPASITVLARYAALCGVSACASMLSKYGISIGRLLGTAGPDRFVDRLAAGLTEAHGDVRLHLFPFGGITQSVAWIEQYRSRVEAATSSQQP